MLSLVLLGVTVICVLVRALWNRREFYMLTRKIPGPLGYPLIGMAHRLFKREEILDAFNTYEEKHGPLVYSWLGPFPFLIINEPQFAQDVLTSPHCVNKGLIYEALDDATGRGLFSLKDPQWSIHRKLINPAFSLRVLKSFIPIFNRECDRMLDILAPYADTEPVNVTEVFQELTLNIATKTTMGTNIFDLGVQENRKIISAYKCLLENIATMCFCPWLRYKSVKWLFGRSDNYDGSKRDIRNFIRTLIKENLQKDNNNCAQTSSNGDDDQTKKSNTFIEVAIDLLKTGDFTEQNVEDESNVIVFGAFETTANSIVNILVMLAMHPAYQQKAFEEVLSVFPDRDNLHVKYDDLLELKYLDLIINETMRVMAPVPIVSRQVESDMYLSNGVRIPRGTQIAIDIFYMHRRKDIWGDEAHIFNPENFLPSNMDGKHSYAYIPFTKGIRNCIGSKYAILSIKVALAKLLRNYRFTTKFKFDDLEFVENITVKLKQMPLLQIERRT